MGASEGSDHNTNRLRLRAARAGSKLPPPFRGAPRARIDRPRSEAVPNPLPESLPRPAGAATPAPVPAQGGRDRHDRGVRGLGRRGQGNGHPAADGAPGPADLPRLPRIPSLGARAALPLAVALPGPPPRGRTDGSLRPL